ncbi:MAG TPA: translation initiation factor IF-3 [Thermoanaerobaculaceae bacterium]|nr:translation initiation factor IF-3 [Thermoanaerobaculaceae bacterium]
MHRCCFAILRRSGSNAWTRGAPHDAPTEEETIADERDRTRINEMIRLTPVRLVDADGSQVGIVPVEEALALARTRGLDLVEVAPTARPIVCKIMDWGKYRYEQEKKARVARRKEHQIEIKEIKFRPGVADHDFHTKLGLVRKFLEQGKHVKVTIMFRRREMRRPENGYEVMERIKVELADMVRLERDVGALEGRDLTMVLAPHRKSA